VSTGDSGLPDAAAVNTFGACLTDLWRNEQPRTRLVARISLDSKTAVSNQQDALINCLTALRPWVGAVQVQWIPKEIDVNFETYR